MTRWNIAVLMDNMNTIGIDKNLNRARIRKLLTIGLFASIMTGVGDFLLGYGADTAGLSGVAGEVMNNAPNVADWQLIAGGLLGFFGIFLEGLSFFAIYRLMADSSLKYAHIYRAGIFGYIWLAPIGCHLNMGILNMAYKHMLQIDPAVAEEVGSKMVSAFSIPIYALLVLFWVPMLVIQIKAFAKGLTPYPKKAAWFNLFTGAVPVLIISMLIEMIWPEQSALATAVGTTFLSCGNAVTFGGLLATLPSEERFVEFERNIS